VTLADRIRAIASAQGYRYLLTESERRAERKEIARELRCATQAVKDALKRSPVRGKPRNPALTRCALCGQPMTAAQHAAAAESTAPTP